MIYPGEHVWFSWSMFLISTRAALSRRHSYMFFFIVFLSQCAINNLSYIQTSAIVGKSAFKPPKLVSFFLRGEWLYIHTDSKDERVCLRTCIFTRVIMIVE